MNFRTDLFVTEVKGQTYDLYQPFNLLWNVSTTSTARHTRGIFFGCPARSGH